MPGPELTDRLAGLPGLSRIPLEELQWLVEHGRYEALDAGSVVAPAGRRIEDLWVILSGRVVVRVDRGIGPRRVIDWRAGDVSGLLPYSRMTGPPGDNFFEEDGELLRIHEEFFPEMIGRCPMFTAYTVHTMLDRARRFNTSALQDEKMVSLGKLAAGLAHELNNPASATVRGAKMLLGAFADADAAARALGAAGLEDEEFRTLERFRALCLEHSDRTPAAPLELAELEDQLSEWLERNGVSSHLASSLADSGLSTERLDALAAEVPPEVLEAALHWTAAGCAVHALASDVQRAATRIHELVTTVKKFTYMDSLAGPEDVDVGSGLRDTIRILAAKAKAQGVTVTLDGPADLPRARATGGELNQVWMNLLDNALDAVPEGGVVRISAQREVDRIVVRFVDNGPGIDPDVLPFVFDPFFTTKPPGTGTGLGLDITRQLLRRYGGEVSAESHPGHTEFRVSLQLGLGEPRSASRPEETVG